MVIIYPICNNLSKQVHYSFKHYKHQIKNPDIVSGFKSAVKKNHKTSVMVNALKAPLCKAYCNPLTS